MTDDALAQSRGNRPTADTQPRADVGSDSAFDVRALATRDSLAALTELMHRGYAALAAQGMNLFAATQTEDDTRARSLSGQTFVAAHGRDLVGTVTVSSPLDLVPGSIAASVPYYREPGSCRFHQFALDPDWRGRGVAHRLLAHAEDWARARHYQTIATDMAEGAEELCAFYRRMGYRPVDHLQFPGKTYRSVVMTKALQTSPLLSHTLMLARYNVWATERLLGAVDALSDADYRRPMAGAFTTIHDMLNTLMFGEHHHWWQRIVEHSSAPLDRESLDEPDRRRLAHRLREGAARWAPAIETWSFDRLHGVLVYRDRSHAVVSVPLAQVLAHVFHRGTHFRALVSAALVGQGQALPELELIRMLQEEAKAT